MGDGNRTSKGGEQMKSRENPEDVVNEQAEDEGLWFVAETVTEAKLQDALRRLTAAVEGTPWPMT